MKTPIVVKSFSSILDLLNQGEAVHSLQRAIHNGVITAILAYEETAHRIAAPSGPESHHVPF